MDDRGVFSENGQMRTFFVKTNKKALCLICMKIVSVLKYCNLKRFFMQKYAAKSDGFQGMFGKDKIPMN